MPVTAADARTVDELISVIRAGGQPKYLAFWGHQPPAGGGVGKGCLSQWWPAAFTVDGEAYASAEHFMMASKALLFGDAETADLIRAAPHPKRAKDLGRQVRGFDEQVWAERRFDLVVTGNLAKFGQHADLRDFLLGTGSRVLVEAAPNDRIWGIGLAADHEHLPRALAWLEPARLRPHGGTPAVEANGRVISASRGHDSRSVLTPRDDLLSVSVSYGLSYRI